MCSPEAAAKVITADASDQAWQMPQAWCPASPFFLQLLDKEVSLRTHVLPTYPLKHEVLMNES